MPGDLAAFLTGLREDAGRRTVEENLVQVADRALAFYRESLLTAVSIFFERQMFEAYRAGLLERGAGPHMVNRWLADYLRAEQELGRVRADAAPDAAASLLLGACIELSIQVDGVGWAGVNGEKEEGDVGVPT